jgi:catechol 2,3-dioxygenase-like lactoylglutathione lyase family enzyme
MALQALDHINITTARLAETRAFFVAVLGLEEGPRPDFGVPGHWLYLGDRPVVHLVGVEDQRLPTREASLDHFAFRIDDFSDAQARLEAAGLEYQAMDVPGTTTRQIFVLDPNGVRIELNCPGQATAK